MFSLGIDIGTTSICGVVCDYRGGLVESVTKANSTGLSADNSWEKCQDAKAILDIVRSLIDEMCGKYPGIEEIGISGQMHGILYVDAAGNAVSPLYTWQDGRGNLMFDDNITYASYLSSLSGYNMSTGFGLTTHFYNMRNGLVPEDAVRLCTVMDYVAASLAGVETPVTDASNAASLGMFDKRTLSFDSAALERCGILYSMLPSVAESVSVVGLYKGTIPVITAIGDNQASYLGSVRDPETTIHVTIGTSSQISVFTKDYIEAPGTDTRPLPGGGYIMVGAALCGGSTMWILNRFFYNTVKRFAGIELPSSSLYDMMALTGYSELTDESLSVITTFNGTRVDPGKRGSVANISSDNFTPANLILGFLRGLVDELHEFYQQFPSIVREGRAQLVGCGNGLHKNPAMRRILEDRFSRPLTLSSCTEEAAMGACLCAMVGNGKIDSFSSFWK